MRAADSLKFDGALDAAVHKLLCIKKESNDDSGC